MNQNWLQFFFFFFMKRYVKQTNKTHQSLVKISGLASMLSTAHLPHHIILLLKHHFCISMQ